MVVVLLFRSGCWGLMLSVPRLEVTHLFSGGGIWAEAGLGGFCRHGWARCKAHLASGWLPCAFMVWFEMLSRALAQRRGVGRWSSISSLSEGSTTSSGNLLHVELLPLWEMHRDVPTTHRFGGELQQLIRRENILALCGPSSTLCRRQIHLVSILLSPSVTLKFLWLMSLSYENPTQNMASQGQEVIAHRYISKLLNWYQPNDKGDFG